MLVGVSGRAQDKRDLGGLDRRCTFPLFANQRPHVQPEREAEQLAARANDAAGKPIGPPRLPGHPDQAAGVLADAADQLLDVVEPPGAANPVFERAHWVLLSPASASVWTSCSAKKLVRSQRVQR